MANHLYAVGDSVSLEIHYGQLFAKLNPFTVEALMPPVGTNLQYRVKSEAETCRRVAAEHQLTAALPQVAHAPAGALLHEPAPVA